MTPLHEQIERLVMAVAEAAASNRTVCLNSLQDHAREIVARVKRLEEASKAAVEEDAA